MNIEFYTMMLLMTVVWPLLLAIPALQSRLPRPRYLALVPAVVLFTLPSDVSIKLPWLLYGTGVSLDGNSRWILGAFIVIWFAAATLTLPAKQKTTLKYSSTFYLLTMAGNLGALLTTDLVGFFVFSTLMSYGFYGLIIQDGDKALQRAGRLYLYFLIVADLALFEALLLMAFTTNNFQYEMARQAMSTLSASPIYPYMVLIGFILKAGIWPFYFWLSNAFHSCSRTIALLLVGGPITISLVGLLRWLPVREDSHIIGIVLQVLGAAAILHFTLRLFLAGKNRFSLSWFVIASTGLFSLVLGTMLLNSSWQQHVYIAYPFIATVSILFTIVILMFGKNIKKPDSSNTTPHFITNLFDRFNTLFNSAQQSVSKLKHKTVSLGNNAVAFVIRQYENVFSNSKIIHFVTGWKINITLFVILVLTIAWLAN